MKIVVYGLGIIGASLCASLKRAGHTVFGKNRSREPVEYALSHRMIDGETVDYRNADVVFLALPPAVTMRELAEGDFPEGCIVCDICGVKEPIERTVYSSPRRYRYVGAHPMAGKATTGIRSAAETLFDNANLVLVRAPQTDEAALQTIYALARDMRFGRVVECGAAEHDKMIALTSQLAHIVSSAYVKSPLTEHAVGFTGGSFQDMTRVAPMEERVWTELFLLNREPLLSELERVQTHLKEYAEAIAAGDEERVRALIRDGKGYHSRFFSRDDGEI